MAINMELRMTSYIIGEIYSFRTRGWGRHSEENTGRYAAVKIIGLKNGDPCCMVLDGIFDHPPSFSEVSNLECLTLTYLGCEVTPAVAFAMACEECGMEEMRLLGETERTQKEQKLRSECRRYSCLGGQSGSAEAEWRWANDREKLIIESNQQDLELKKNIAAAELRQKTRLSKLTWEKLLGENTFEKWVPEDTFPNRDLTFKIRRIVHSTMRYLEALEKKPTKRITRKALRDCVETLNEENERNGQFINTDEREDICEVLEEIAYVAGHFDLSYEIGDWRNW